MASELLKRYKDQAAVDHNRHPPPLLHLYHHHDHHHHLVELLIDGERNTWFDVAVDVVLHPSAVYPTDGLQLQSLGSGHLEFLQVRLCVRINFSIQLIRI